MFFCNNTIDDARKQKYKSKHDLIANRPLRGRSIVPWTLCQGKKCFFFRERGKKTHS
jgi:hypothetical protein